MTARGAWLAAACLAAASGAAGGGVAPEQEAPSGAATPAPRVEGVDALVERVPQLLERLEALSPEDPSGYFELGEEVAYEAQTSAEYLFARRLYVLALHLNLSASGPESLSASVCVALADIERDDQSRRWLRAIAGTLDPRQARTDWSRSDPEPDDEAAFNAAVALGYIRSGEGAIARRYMDRPGVREVLDRYAGAATGRVGSVAALEERSRRHNTPGDRVVRERARDGTTTARLNPETGGNPGPALTTQELIDWLRVEAVLLDGVQQSWAAQVAADRGAPLREPDPHDVAPAYMVDTARTVWRDGAWAIPEDGEADGR